MVFTWIYNDLGVPVTEICVYTVLASSRLDNRVTIIFLCCRNSLTLLLQYHCLYVRKATRDRHRTHLASLRPHHLAVDWPQDRLPAGSTSLHRPNPDSGNPPLCTHHPVRTCRDTRWARVCCRLRILRGNLPDRSFAVVGKSCRFSWAVALLCLPMDRQLCQWLYPSWATR